VELHGGRVWADSAGPGRGSTFEVQLPLAPEPAAADAPERPSSGEVPCQKRVLVTDDNRDGADTLAMVIRLLGCEVRTAYDGPSAIAAVESFAPDVVFMDLGMPGMDGFEAARRIRALPHGDDTVLIALTGWGQDRDREQTRRAGFDAHVVKPVDPAAVRDLLGAPAELDGRAGRAGSS
jgi:CheY-like chemotaxis protein